MRSSPAGPLLAYLCERQEEMAALLEELAAAESPSHDPAAQDPVLARLASELARAGLAVRFLRGRRAGGQLYAAPPRARRRRGAAAQLVLGHCDTVWPRGTLAAMPLERRDGCLYGPGVFDMKAGLVQALFALRALAELRLEPPARPLVFVNSDEEVGSTDSLRRIRRLARCVRRVYVLEPALGARGLLKTRRKGVGHFNLTVSGRAAHAGLEPEQGASAVLELAHCILRLAALADPARGISVNVGVVAGGLRGNVVAPEARAEIDVRAFDAAGGEELARAIRGLAPTLAGTRLEVTGGFDRPPLEPTAGNRALFAAAQDAARELGFELGEGSAGGASDGNITSLYAPTLDGLGAVGAGAHAAHEHVELDRMPQRAALLALLLLAPLQ